MSLYSTILCWAHPARKFREMSMECCQKLLIYLQETKGVDFKIESSYGCYIICDLRVDEAYHDLLSILPPLIHSFEVTDSLLSPFQADLKTKYGIKTNGERLIADFLPNPAYIISAIALKMYLRAGVIIDNIVVCSFLLILCYMV